MSEYAVDTTAVRSTLTAVGAQGQEFADGRLSTRTSITSTAAACGDRLDVAAAVRTLRGRVHDAQDAVQQHAGSCVTAVTDAVVAYEVADVDMASATNMAGTAVGAWRPW